MLLIRYAILVLFVFAPFIFSIIIALTKHH